MDSTLDGFSFQSTTVHPPSIDGSKLAATEAERRVLCSMLLEEGQECIAPLVRKLDVKHFTTKETKQTFAIIQKLHREGNAVHAEVVLNELKKSGVCDDANVYLASVATSTTTWANYNYESDRLLEAHQQRQINDLVRSVNDDVGRGLSSQEILNNLHAGSEDILRDSAQQRSPFTAITAAELDQGDYSINYLVEGALIEGQPCVVAGPKKALKTTILVDLAISLAGQRKFLGKFWVPESKRVLLCSGESGMATLQETSRRIASAKGLSLSDLSNYMLTDQLPKLDNDESLGYFGDFIDYQGADVVMVDPAYLCMGGDDASNLFKQGAMLLKANEVCSKQRATLIIAHHMIKAADKGKPELNQMAWTGFQEFARQWMLLGRRKKYVPGSGDHKLWFTSGGSAAHGGEWALDIYEGPNNAVEGREYNVTLNLPGDTDDGDSGVDHEQKVIDAMVELGKPETKSVIAEKAGVSGSECTTAIESLEQQGVVLETKVPKGNNQEYKGYKLK